MKATVGVGMEWQEGFSMRRLTTILVSTTALFGLISAASAADLRPAYKAPAPVAAPMAYSWSGFYIGGHAGGGWTDLGITDGSSSGFVGGGQIGYNWALSPSWVIGIEADFSGTSISESASFLVPGFGTLNASADLNWLATVRGRLGYTWDRFMIYVTGGGAWADVDASASLAGVTVNASGTASGWVIGGGGEWMFAPNWTFGVEYLHYEFDSISGDITGPGFVGSFSGDTDGKVDVVRARLNYKFGDWFGKGKSPVSARY
jgi:outer membrane immunogenic protein